MENRKRQPAKTTRQWMELIRDCAKQRGSFIMRDMLQRHNFRGKTYSVAVRKAVPISGNKHSFWSGPKPKDEAELRIVAERAMNTYYQYKRKQNEAARKAKAPAPRQQQAAVPTRVWIAQPPPQVVINPRPSATATPKAKPKRRRRVRILWGLISWG